MQAGMPAGRLSLLYGMPLAALADGSVAVADDQGHPGLVGLDGRVRPLPPLIESRRTLEELYMAAEADGALLAAGVDRYVHRLRPGATAWERAFDLRRIGADPGGNLVGLPGGGFALWADLGIWRISDDGGAQRVRLPAGAFPRGVFTALRDGSLAIETSRGIVV